MIIPCYEDGPLLLEAVRSIREQEPVEVVVVDDCSRDERTRGVLRELERDGFSVLRHDRNLGVSHARTSGLRATSARYVFPLDADDLAVPGALAAMADRLDAEPSAAACFGDYAEFGEREIVRAVPDRLDPYRLAYTNEYPVSSLFRRSALDAVGGWRPNDYSGSSYEDWNLWMTVAEHDLRAVHLGHGRITYRRRLHENRKLTAGRRRHRQLYGELRAEHPKLFGGLREHRRRSDLSLPRKLLYPIVYGGRPRLRVEPRVKALLDRLGIWTLRR